ncbi:tail fiber protein [uncultured Pelagimonas sp.]|uniref:phage tail protein n=1 Tax=uncultured Pelagimonas sp. TaxID=1618102 RepID=UPI00262E348A|nr:tail fiber protein [uncultured Pelagimonas sp.]
MAQPTITGMSSSAIRRRSRTYDVEAAAAKMQEVIAFITSSYVLATDVGDLKPTLAKTAPDGWLMLDGSTFDAAQYPDLFAAIGTNQLPNFRDRYPIGAGGTVAPGLLDTGGATNITLTAAQMPAHTHGVTDGGHTHVVNDPGHAHAVTDPGHSHTGLVAGPAVAGGAAVGAVPGATSVDPSGVTVDAAQSGITIGAAQSGMTIDQAGGGAPVPITPPYVGVNWMIKT